MSNYFNRLNFREKISHLKKSRFIPRKEFKDVINNLKEKKIVIIGCGSQGLNQGLNMRDSGLNIKFSLKKESINNKNKSWIAATSNDFVVDCYENLIPEADLVINLTPDKQHSNVINKIQYLMKQNAVLGYSHGLNIVEYGEKIRKDLTVIMVAPKCPGPEVRKEFIRGFGVPSLIAVHSENNPLNLGLEFAKSWAKAIGSHRAGVLESSFVAEVKSDLMGEQTILCGLLQSASLILYDKMISEGMNKSYVGKIIQNGWEVITESLKQGGITLMMDRLENNLKLNIFNFSNQLKKLMKPLFYYHMDNIISGKFSSEMFKDWNNNDKFLKSFRKKMKHTSFEKCPKYNKEILEQDYFNDGALLIAIIKAGIELAFEIMVESGISAESAYYESLHELPLIANIISKNKLYGMNIAISDTAEYGNYLFSNSAIKLLKEFMHNMNITNIINNKNKINNVQLMKMNEKIYNHPVEIVGRKLRLYMRNMKSVNFN